MAINDFKILTIFFAISFLSFIFRYIFRITFTSNKVNALIACHICLKFIFNRKEKPDFIWPKTFDFIFQKHSILIQKKEIFLENSCSWIFYVSQVNMFLACHLSKIYLQSERKMWFYLDQNILLHRFLFRKKRYSLKIVVPEFSIFLKTTCFLYAIFLKFIFSQKENRGYLAQNIRFFYFKYIRTFIQKKKLLLENSCSWISKI